MNIRYSMLSTFSVAGVLMTMCVASLADDGMRFNDHPLAGRILDTRSGTLIDQPGLVEALAEARYILIGEKHDNARHHEIEQRLVERLVDGETRLVLEMLDDRPRAPLSTLAPGDSAEILREKLDWPENQWPWNDYGPLIETALERGGAIAVGNINRQLVRTMYGGDTSGLDGDPRFVTVDILEPDERETVLDQLYISHCETMPREALGPMLTIQSARDAAMAHAMVAADAATPPKRSVLIAGGFHVRRDLGVPRHLQSLDTTDDIVALLMVEVNPDQPDPDNYAEAVPSTADFIWFTPAAPEEDYCAGLTGKHSNG